MVIQTLSRRKLLGGLGLLIAAPAIVKASSLMPVKAYAEETPIGLADGTYVRYNEATGLYTKFTWVPLSKCNYWHDADGKFRYAMAAEPIRAGQPVVLR